MTAAIPEGLMDALDREHRDNLIGGISSQDDGGRVALTLHRGKTWVIILAWRRHPMYGWIRDRRASADRLEALADRPI